MYYFIFPQREILFGPQQKTKLQHSFVIVALTSDWNIIIYAQQLKRQVAWMSQELFQSTNNRNFCWFDQKPGGLWVWSETRRIVGFIRNQEFFGFDQRPWKLFVRSCPCTSYSTQPWARNFVSLRMLWNVWKKNYHENRSKNKFFKIDEYFWVETLVNIQKG